MTLYLMVLKLGGGSIRIHDPEIQRKVFDFLGLKKEEMTDHFGFLLEAQEFGFPLMEALRWVLIALLCFYYIV